MRNRRGLPLLLMPLLIGASTVARADEVDDYVKAEMQKQRIPGVSIAVVKDGKVEKAQGYGLANIELNIPVKPESVFMIGSCSKQFLAAGIMLLLQDGKLDLDDKVSKYLEGTPETWQDITIRHFLTHTSGVLRESPKFEPFKVQTDAEVVKGAYGEALHFKPGEKMEYCNVGYFALAEIIHKVSGKSWGDFLAERVFKPLGMTATCPTDYFNIIPDRAFSYGIQQDKLVNAPVNLSVRPSGGFLSTVLDMAKWDAALYGDNILTPASREQMWTPVTLTDGKTSDYGFGWSLGAPSNHRLVHHGGSLAGFQSEFARFVDDKLTIVVLTNARHARPDNMARRIADIYVPDVIPDAKFDITGNWAFETQIDGQQGAPQFSFTQNGNALAGKYKGQFGEAEIEGVVEGDKLEFRFRSPQGSGQYRGTIADKDHMQGEAAYGGPPGTWTGKRQ